MADPDHVAQLKKGATAWNAWREENPDIDPDLTGANLSIADLMDADLGRAQLRGAKLMAAKLSKANLRGANLSGAHLVDADLIAADLREANLNGADLTDADLRRAKLRGAQLRRANLTRADFNRAHLKGANLAGANLYGATLLGTDLTGADLTGCRIYGISVWNVKLNGAQQQNLIITLRDEPEITLDNIEVAQFIYLLLHNQKIRHFIDTITSKVVLILGRFTAERKTVLDALREELRKRDYLPVLFDFEKPHNLTTDETITLLARMARYMTKLK